MRTQILSVFPACGKTWVYNHQAALQLRILDSDSSQFSWVYEKDCYGNVVRKRNPEFPANYIKHIKENIGKYDYIFVSSHASVRDLLDQEGIDFVIVYPFQGCKAEWVGRCYIREKNGESGCSTELMYNNYEQWLAECMETGKTHQEVMLLSGEYLSNWIINHVGSQKRL